MIQDRPIAVLVLCLAAIVLGAVLFPAAGMDATGATAPGDGSVDAPGPDGHGATDDSAESDGVTDETDGGTQSSGDGSTDDQPGDGDSDSDETDANETGDDSASGDASDDEVGLDEGTSGDDGALTLVLLGVGLFISYYLWALTDPTRIDGVATADLPDGTLPRLILRIRRLPQATMFVTLGLARRGGAVASVLAGSGAATVGGLGRLLGSVGSAVTNVRLPSLRPPGGVPLVALRWPSFGWLTGSDRTRSRDSTAGRANRSTAGPSERSARTGPAEPESVEAAWDRVVSSLSIRRESVRTPRECAAVAIDAGMPEDAVVALTETFELVRYGGIPETQTHVERARSAYERIRKATGGDRP